MKGRLARKFPRTWKAFAVLAGLFVGTATAQTPPERIVSINVCTDQLLLALVPQDRIVALSALANDPRESAYAEAASALPRTTGGAEDVYSRRPDLVLAGSWSDPQTVALLRRLGIDVLIVPSATDFEGIARNLRTVGEATGTDLRANVLIDALEAALADMAAPDLEPETSLFVDYGPGGYIAGSQSLTAAAARRAGLTPLADVLGRETSGFLTLEELLIAAPDVVALDGAYGDSPTLRTENLRHPALGQLLARVPTPALERALVSCGSPRTVTAATALSGHGRP